ncbi:GAF and ANTAR domain-containing protein [Streptomyces sp. NPDC005476]|uniref:GAF and ANTAR domain-containing protein n=1 Tax=Streptomyces sp. NPDC005476 TaxID=3156882 RepID=UPI003454C7BC
MAGDEGAGDHVPGGDAEPETDVQRARIAHQLVAAVHGQPPDRMPDVLCRACTALLPELSGLSVSVTGKDADAGVVLCASDEVAARLAEIQYTLGEGPCMEAVRLRAPVFAADLGSAPDNRRWPLFSMQAARAGARAAFSVPLTGAGGALGTLDLYRDAPGSLSADQVRTALLVADAVTMAVIALDHASANGDGAVTWLEGAEADREEVHQATGMIMVQLGVSAQEALVRLRARAFAQGRTSTEVARDVIGRTLDLRSD